MTVAIKKKINIPDPAMGPVGFTAASFKAAISGIGTILKKPKIILTTLFISVLQAALSYLKILMPSSFLVTLGSFFTFAQGGMYAGLLGAAGGIVGKGIYAWFMNTLFFSGSKVKSKNEQSEKTERKTKGKIALFLAGTGIALIAYNFLTGNASLENGIIGITALAACVRAIKKKNGFLIGLICSFTKGRMSRNTAAGVIKGMAFGFLAGVLSSLKFTGIICYIAGAIIFILALILLAGRKRTVAGAAALILFLSSGFPAYSSLLPDSEEWMTPWEAYGITYMEGSFDSYNELTQAMSASPPASMELTLIALGDNSYFYESDRIEGQKVLAIDGNSETFSVDSPESWYFKFTSSMNLILEDNGWYVDSLTSYSINNAWTNLETEEGLYSDYQGCGFPYFPNLPSEPGEFYIIIPIEFQYGDESKVYSRVELIARVDRVKREYSQGQSPVNYAGSWQLKEIKSYFIEPSRDSYRTAVTNEFKDEFSGSDPTYNTIATVSGNTINYKIITDYPPTVKSVQSFTADFSGLPEQMKAFETLRVTANGSGFYEDEINNEGKTYDSVPISVGLLPGLRPDKFRTAETDTDTVVYPLGIVGETWFENVNGAFQAAAPQGQQEGELLTVELILGSNSAYDATQSRHMGTPVIAYIYEWNMQTAVPAETEDEEDEDTGSNGGWWSGTDTDTDDEWNEHASEEETVAIGAMSAIAAIAGAGAAAAGSIGMGPGGGYGSYIKRNKDGDLVVRDPVTGEESLYVGNKKTGLYTNPLTGAEYTEDELTSHVVSRAENAGVLGQDYETAQEAIKQQRKDNQELSQAESEVNLEKSMKKLQKDLETKGAIGDDYADELAKKLKILRSQKKVDGEFNKDDLKKFQRTFNKWTRGEIAGSRGLPKAENDWEIFKQGLSLSGEEIARGESWKAIGLRVAVGLLTGSLAARGVISLAGAAIAEAGLELGQAGYTMKDYVDKGGDDWTEGAKLAITKTLVGEGIGRTIGLGLKGLDFVASKTGQALSKTKAGKYVVDGISDAVEKTSKVMNANVGDVPKVIKQISKEASESATAAKKAASMAGKLKTTAANKVAQTADDAARKAAQTADDAAKKAAQSADDAAKKAAQTADDAAKNTAQSTEDAVKKSAQSTEDAAKKAAPPKTVKDTDAYKQASQDIDDSLRKINENTAKKIEKYKNSVNKNPKLAARKAAYEEGGKIGLEKVEKLEQARKALASNPDSPQLKKEFESAVKDVQINKHAQKIMNEKKLTGNDTRQGFNDFKVKQDAIVSLNTSERLALELGLDPKNVSNVQATNSMDTSGVKTIKGVAVKSDFKTAKTTAPRKFTEADIDLNSLEKKSGEKISIDLDQTYRMEIELKDGTVIAKDIPAYKVKSIQNEEVYKVWNDGQLPLNPDGSVNHKAVEEFAEDMDYTVVDARSADAYGTLGDLEQALKNDGTIRQYNDPEVVSKTISYKSDEWIRRSKGKIEAGEIIDAEADVSEGIRQSTKQFNSQYVYQVKAINANAGKTKIVINEKLAEGMEVLKQIGFGEGKLSPAEAEAILKEMGTNSEEVMKLLADQVEIINRLIAGGKK
jgi:hypothetical protein